MSITTQITVAATAETIIITAPGALRGPMGDVTPEVTALVVRAELGASQAATSAGQASSSAAQAGDSAAEAASSAGSASGSAIAAAEDAADAGESKLSAEQSAADAAASASAAGRFIMVSATAPTQRTNNTPLQIADEWQDSVNNLRMSWTGTAWVALNSSAQQLEARLADPLQGAALVGYKAWWNSTQRLAVDLYVQDVVPYGFNFGTQDASAWVQYAWTQKSKIILPRRINIDQKVYQPSDYTVDGEGGEYSGTVVYTRSGETIFSLGAQGQTTHTRCGIRGMRFISNGVPTRENYFIEAPGAFMDTFEDLYFGDVSGVGNQQNGIRINGTANYFDKIRALRQEVEPALPDTTGIAIYQTGVNSFGYIQLETGSRFIAENDRGSSIANLHMERSSLILRNSTKMSIRGGYAIDGSIELDDRSAGNDLAALGGANIRMNDLGMFNKYSESIGSLAGNGATNFGIDKSYVPQVNAATVWNDAVQAGYKLQRDGWHVAIVLCKNMSGNGSSGSSQTGTIDVFNVTTGISLGTKSVTLPNIAGIVTPSGAAANSHRTIVLLFQGAINDVIQVNGAIVQKATIAPAENINPAMVAGSAWGVAGAPPVPGESYFASLTSCTVAYDTGFKLTTPASGSFSLTQLFRSRIDADLYCVILKGDWPDAQTLSIRAGQSAHDGARSGKVAQSQAIRDGDGRKTLVQYLTKRDMIGGTPSRTSISVGSTLSAGVATIPLDMFVVFPVR